jgi:hypothetical protein
MKAQQPNDIRSQVREAARNIIRRVIDEPGFAGQLRADPRAACVAAGVPETAVDEFLTNDLGLEADVSGYLSCYVTGFLWEEGEGEEEEGLQT